MKHASSRELFRYWTTLRGGRLAPPREAIDPAALRRVLGDSFVLGSGPATAPVIRLAGTRVCALFCRELKATAFLQLWAGESRGMTNSLVDLVTVELTAVVAGVLGQWRNGPPLPLELLLLPLAPGATRHSRLIGVLAPLAPAHWIGTRPVETLTLGAFRHIAPEAAPASPRRAPVCGQPAGPVRYSRPGHKAPHLVVYEGGAATGRARSHRSLSDQ
jgi:hypothetical protein